MKNIATTLLLMSFLLGACSTTDTTPDSVIIQNTPPPDASIATEPAVSARVAVLSEIENNVSARILSTSEFSPASNGLSIFETGNVETGDNSRARLDLIPDGTIVRIGPNSSFVLTALTTENNEPRTKLDLLFGQVFILLNGGSLDVETPSGVASVRGSLMSVTFSQSLNRATTTCLEGHCVVYDEDEEIELTEGQAADFIDGDLEDDLRDMTFEELGLWILDNPDLEEHIEDFPDLPGLPEDFDWNYDFNNDPDFGFFFDPEYDPGQQILESEYLENDTGDFPLPDPDATIEPVIEDPPIP